MYDILIPNLQNKMPLLRRAKLVLLYLIISFIFLKIIIVNRHQGRLFTYFTDHAVGGIKVACFILATLNNQEKLSAVNETWVQHCDKYFYVITSKKGSHDVVNVSIPEGRDYLTDKVVFAFQHMYQNYLHDYDWFVKADDDTYMVIENLKLLASYFKGVEPAYIGNHFKHFSPFGYMSGGCGYAINTRALKLLIAGFKQTGLCRVTGGAEDLEIGRCLTKTGVPIISSLDRYDRQTFQASHIHNYRTGKIPGWITFYLRNVKQHGKISEYTISYHRISPDTMRLLHFVLYNMRVYKPRENLEDYFKLDAVPPIKDFTNETRFMAYFFESIDLYKDHQRWRRMNNTVLTHFRPNTT